MANVTGNEFCSEFGWAIDLPSKFERLEAGGRHPGTPVTVFVAENDSRLLLTWMALGVPVSEDVATQFAATVKVQGPVDSQRAIWLAQRIFPLIGQLDSCAIVQLRGGTCGLELLETFQQPGEHEQKRGYQLIMPLHKGEGYPPTFERICFYAPITSFERLLPDVRAAATSFRYRRPFGLKSSSGEEQEKSVNHR